MALSPPLVPAVERAAAILDLIATSERPLRLSDIVNALGLPKSSAHGLCQTLCALGILHALPEGFAMGVKVSFWAEAFDQKSILINAFREAAQSNPALAQYTLTLSTREGADVIYLACLNSDAPLGLTFRPGMRLPAVYTATGKSLLAQLPPAELASLTTPWPKAFTTKGVADLNALQRQLDTVHLTGIGVDDSELREGMVCLAAPILQPNGKAIAAVSLSLTSAECPADGRAPHEAAIRDLASAIAERAYGRPMTA